MLVSARHIAAAALATMLAGPVAAGGGKTIKHDRPIRVQTPPVHVGAPQISVGGPRVNIRVETGATAVAAGRAAATTIVAGDAGARSTVLIGGGGGGFFGIAPPAPSALNSLTVVSTGSQVVSSSEKRAVEVAAVCLDDKGVPHPASQVFPEQAVAEDYHGEIYRCIAGTRLQATVDGTSVIHCEKGEALVHGPGGALACAPQIPRRDCNERSLLRKFGPGTKIVHTRVERHEVVEETVEEAGGPIVFDGGVGGFPNAF